MSIQGPLPEILALFGQPVVGNPTQQMMEVAFADKGLNWRYLTLEVEPEDLQNTIQGMRAMHFLGAHITKPHKVAVVRYLDRLTEAAATIGAVNCIFRDGSELVGENTDGKGFIESLETLVDPLGKTVVLLGAGGAARAIGVELMMAGVERIMVVNRNVDRGTELTMVLSKRLGKRAEYIQWKGNYEVPSEAGIVINATSLGMNASQVRVPISFTSLTRGTIVADVVFNPPNTLFLQEARTRGGHTLDGLGMLVNQGVISFRIWTGVEPNTTIMRKALEETLYL